MPDNWGDSVRRGDPCTFSERRDQDFPGSLRHRDYRSNADNRGFVWCVLDGRCRPIGFVRAISSLPAPWSPAILAALGALPLMLPMPTKLGGRP